MRRDAIVVASTAGSGDWAPLLGVGGRPVRRGDAGVAGRHVRLGFGQGQRIGSAAVKLSLRDGLSLPLKLSKLFEHRVHSCFLVHADDAGDVGVMRDGMYPISTAADLGALVRGKRRSLAWTQEHLAAVATTSRDWISRWRCSSTIHSRTW